MTWRKATTWSRILSVLGLLAGLVLGSRHAAAEALPQLGITLDATSVSGLSAGAYMAGQIELAHSKDIVGAGVAPQIAAVWAMAQRLAERP